MHNQRSPDIGGKHFIEVLDEEICQPVELENKENKILIKEKS